jgi:Ca2+-binding RTX toxin-like protein
VDINSSGATVENGANLSGYPAVTINGTGVTFINKSGASVSGSAAIAIRASGTTVVNEAGALIEGTGASTRRTAIEGSDFADNVINRGRILGEIDLRGGDDRYEVFLTPENLLPGNQMIRFGAGDDTAVLHADARTYVGLILLGDSGYDTLRMDGIGSLYGSGMIVYGFERLVLTGSGDSSTLEFRAAEGVEEVFLSSGLTLSFEGVTFAGRPAAQYHLQGGSLKLSGQGGSVAGTDAGESLDHYGTLTGSVAMGGGNDRVDVMGDVGGSISLGAGNDILQYDGNHYSAWENGASVQRYSQPGLVAGLVDGGEGEDSLQLFATDGRTVDLSRFVGFEKASFVGGQGDIRLLHADQVSSLTFSGWESKVAFADTNAPGLQLRLDFDSDFEFVIEATATIGGITRDHVELAAWGQSSDVQTVRNAGTITGDVNLWMGDDLYDGRLGSVGGKVLGHSGNDTILLGADADSADGGIGNDLIEGHGGADVLDGYAGDDVLRGGDGNDVLDGHFGRDTLYGGDGSDRLTDIGGGGDALYGEGGDDVIELIRNYQASEERLTIDGGSGDDQIRVDTYNSTVDVDAGAGSDRIVVDGVGAGSFRLGEGADTLVIDNFILIEGRVTGPLRVLDFAPGAGGDRLDLADRPLVRQAFPTWDGTTDLFAAGLLRLVQRGDDTHVEGKLRGNGWFSTLAILANTDSSAFTAANFSGFDPSLFTGATPGPDYLDGGTGADRLAGGAGDDSYFVDHSGDQVIEREGEGFDSVTTSLTAYRLPAGVEVLGGYAEFSQTLRGNELDNSVWSWKGNDILHLGDGGADSASSGPGNDVIYFGAAFGPGDTANGGDGRDALVLQGNVTLVLGNYQLYELEAISLQSGASAKFGDTADNRYDFDVTTADGNVVAGQQMIVNGQSLLAGEDLTFDGSAETDGRFLIYAGHGTDNLKGGAGVDVFFFEGERWGADDRVDGGGGRDSVVISGGTGVKQVTFGANSLTSIESISVNATLASDPSQKPSYEMVLHNGNVAPGGNLIVNGNSLSNPTQTLSVDGSAVQDGGLTFFGGAGNDSFKGGAGGDLLYGGGGKDSLTGNGGADLFQFRSESESSVANPDAVLDFQAGVDKIHLLNMDANSTVAGDQAFGFIGASAFSGAAGQLRAYESGGTWFVEGDTDGNGAADFAIAVTSQGGQPLGQGDFIL